MTLHLPATLLLLTLAGGMLGSIHGQKYVLRFLRPLPTDPNRILLECRSVSDDTLVLGASFFRNGLPYNLPDGEVIPNLGVRFVVDKWSEGNFTCGEEGQISTPPQTIVARPVGTEIAGERISYANRGSEGRLDCSITPGALLPLYYVTWRSASDHSVIFYQIFPPLSSRQPPPDILDNRYRIDSRNFSLFVSNVELADAAHGYQCVLGVVDPRDDQAYDYTATQNVNISLSIFKPPQFVEMPGPQVVSSGDNATFTCSVISSPEESLLSWKLGSRILHRHDTRTRIVPAVTQEAGEIRTTSSLTIFRVTGFDSDVVECFSEYFVTGGIVLSTVRTKTILSVLDEVKLQPPIRFKSGGFIFPIVPKRPLLLPVMVQLLYTDQETGAQTKVPSITTYFNTTPIYHIAFSEQVPLYNRFNLSFALSYKGVEGPMHQSENVYHRETTDSEACDVSEPVKIDKHKGYFSAFWVVLVILILLILVIISIFTASQLVVKNNSELKSEVKKLEKAVTRANYVACNCCSPFQRRCSNAPDGPHQKPENGFTAELAGNVVDSLVRVSTICRGNAMIAQVLKEKKVTISTAVSGNEEITGQGTDDTILDAKDIV